MLKENLMKINSILFHTTKLSEVRNFYEKVLELRIGTYEKDGKEVSDCSDTYVNFDLSGTLLCFETSSTKTELGTLVINVQDLANIKSRLEKIGIESKVSSEQWFEIKDPEGRSLLFEVAR